MKVPACHSERSEESRALACGRVVQRQRARFFTPLRYVQNDTDGLSEPFKRGIGCTPPYGSPKKRTALPQKNLSRADASPRLSH